MELEGGYDNEVWAVKLSLEHINYLDNFVSDMGRQPTLADAIEEAKYILECYGESGHGLCESLSSEDREEREYARRDRAMVKRWLKKWGGEK